MAKRTALVPGAADGFGWETARRLAAAGHRVVLADRAEGVTDRAGTLRDEGHDVIAQAMQGIPAGRVGQPDEIAVTVAFLCSHEAGYMTGTVLDVNGGAFMGG